MARKGTNRPPHPPAAAADVVATAGRMSTGKMVSAEAGVLSTQVIAPPPGPTAADGAGIFARITAAPPNTSPLRGSARMGWTMKDLARWIAAPEMAVIVPERAPMHRIVIIA